MIKHWIMGTLVVTGLTGCYGDEKSDLKAWMESQTEGMQGKVEPLPEVKPYESYPYLAFDLTQPFSETKMEVKKAGAGTAGPDQTRQREPLEAFDLEKLRMVGTVYKNKAMNALIKAPDGSHYTVRKGSYLGQNFGVVIGITETEVKIKEIVEDSGGDWVERPTSLNLDEVEQK